VTIGTNGRVGRSLAPLLVALLLASITGHASGHATPGSWSPPPDTDLIEPPPTIRVVFGERVATGTVTIAR